MDSLDACAATMESVVVHLMEPDASTPRLALNAIAAASNRSPLFWSAAEHVAVTRLLAGNAYSDCAGIPAVDDPRLATLGADNTPLPTLPARTIATTAGDHARAAPVAAAAAAVEAVAPAALARRWRGRWRWCCRGWSSVTRSQDASVAHHIVGLLALLFSVAAAVVICAASLWSAARNVAVSMLWPDDATRPRGGDTVAAAAPANTQKATRPASERYSKAMLTLSALYLVPYLNRIPPLRRWLIRSALKGYKLMLARHLGGRADFRPKRLPLPAGSNSARSSTDSSRRRSDAVNE
jgi:hypothetical protein